MHLRAWVDCLFVCDVSVMGPSCSPGSSRLCDRLHPGAPGERPTGQQRCIDRGISGQATRGTAPVDRVGQKPAVPHPGGNVCGACACRVHVSISPPIQCLHAWCCAVLAHSASTGVVEFCTRAAQASRAKSCQHPGTSFRSRTHCKFSPCTRSAAYEAACHTHRR